MPPQIRCASALPGKTGKHKNCIFHSNARIQPVATWFLQSFWLTTHTHAAVWLPKLCKQCIQLGAVGARFRRKEVKSAHAAGLLHAQCAVFWVLSLATWQGNAEALDMWGGKNTKHRLISYCLSNTSAKNYGNRIVYVKIIASQKVARFFETQCSLHK